MKSSCIIIQLLKQWLTCSRYLINIFWLSEWSSHQSILLCSVLGSWLASSCPRLEFNWSLLPAAPRDKPITCSSTDIIPERILFYFHIKKFMHSFLYGKKLSLLWMTIENVQAFLLFFKGKQFYHLQVPTAKSDMLWQTRTLGLRPCMEKYCLSTCLLVSGYF